MYRKESFVLQMRRGAVAAETFVASTQPWHHDDLVTIQAVSVRNQDGDDVKWEWGVKRYETDVYVETFKDADTAQWQSWSGAITIPSEYKVIVRIISPDAGHRFTINIFGYIERWCSGEDSDG